MSGRLDFGWLDPGLWTLVLKSQIIWNIQSGRKSEDCININKRSSKSTRLTTFV